MAKSHPQIFVHARIRTLTKQNRWLKATLKFLWKVARGTVDSCTNVNIVAGPNLQSESLSRLICYDFTQRTASNRKPYIQLPLILSFVF